MEKHTVTDIPQHCGDILRPSSPCVHIGIRGGTSRRAGSRRLDNEERVPGALWFFAGGRGRAPTVGALRDASRRYAEAQEQSHDEQEHARMAPGGAATMTAPPPDGDATTEAAAGTQSTTRRARKKKRPSLLAMLFGKGKKKRKPKTKAKAKEEAPADEEEKKKEEAIGAEAEAEGEGEVEAATE
ncbi:MAG: hypothetical protein M1814_005761 [Vezdaea aestivalis]|nr:MAG: hypothetical protein M1814_005761 [Vezdaea aestivalis]